MKMLNMRQQFTATLTDLMKTDERLTILLGDIGVFGFRHVFSDHPTRIYNIGILEQSTVGLASGLAMTGLIPVVHTIAPFLVERCYEQLKLDFGYQKLGGNFISVGGSYDYAALGCSHHCPGDVPILQNIPGMSIVVPGTANEFDSLFRESYANQKPNYYRLSETANQENQPVSFGKGCIVKKGEKATILAVGPMLQPVLDASIDIDITILYYTTIFPFDHSLLQSVVSDHEKLIVVEPYYSGPLAFDIMQCLESKSIQLSHIGVPKAFLTNYGTKKEHDEYLGLDALSIRNRLLKIID